MALLTNNDLPSYDRRILEKAYRDEVKPGATAYAPLSNKIREKIRGPANDLVSNIESLPQPENNANSSQPKLSTQPEAEVAQPVAAGDAQGLSG